MIDLEDPVAVYQAMQRGEIAMLTPMHVRSLYREEIEKLIADAHDENLKRAEALATRARKLARIAFLLCCSQLGLMTGVWLFS